MTSTSNIMTTSFPLGLFCTGTLSGPLPEISRRTSPPHRSQKPVAPEPFTDDEVEELTADLCPDEKPV